MHKATPLEGPRQRPRRVPKGRRRPASVASGQTASEKVIKCNFKLGSVERSIDLDKEGIPQQEIIFNLHWPIQTEYFYLIRHFSNSAASENRDNL
jgi:hypothetical protein